MENVRLISLYSGSKGNSMLIGCGADEILIDAGRSLRALTTALRSVGSDLSRIKAIFITHEHSDHTSALEMLSKQYRIPVHMAEASAEQLLATARYLQNNLVVHPPLFEVTVGDLTVRSFPTPHDANCCVGYSIVLPDGSRIGYATDIGHITEEVRSGLLGARAVVLESNHDLEMLRCGPYPASLKARILSPRGHLSNADCCTFLSELAASGTKDVLLAHLSENNNDPDTALCAARKAGFGMHIDVAREGEPVRLL